MPARLLHVYRSDILALCLLLTLYAYVGSTSFGYDDEFHNISIIETKYSIVEIITFVNSIDVHPPGQYIANALLFYLFGNWEAVRVVTSLLVSGCLWLLWKQHSKLRTETRAFSFITICLNPSLLLWCTGVRWYSYFVVFIILYALLLITNPKNAYVYWFSFYTILVAMFYIGYAAIVFIPIAIFMSLVTRRTTIASEKLPLAMFCCIAIAVLLPQIYIFVTIHLKSFSSQTFSFARVASSVALNLLSGQASMPLSVFGAGLMVGNIVLFFSAITNAVKLQLGKCSWIFILGVVGLTASTLAGKFRNLVTISSFHGCFQDDLFRAVRSTVLRKALLVLFLVGNIGGLYNVVMHEDTTKGSWNTPYRAIISDVKNKLAAYRCGDSMLITHDPVVEYYARSMVGHVVNVGESRWEEKIERFSECVIFVNTFRGSLDDKTYSRYKALVEDSAPFDDIAKLGVDKHAVFKRLFDRDVPEYYVSILYKRGEKGRG